MWIADSGAVFHMTESAEVLRNTRPSEHKVEVGCDTLFDVECDGLLTVVSPTGMDTF